MDKRPVERVKAKVWTERMTSEMEGPIAGVCVELFKHLADDKRQLVLDKLRNEHRQRGE